MKPIILFLFILGLNFTSVNAQNKKEVIAQLTAQVDSLKTEITKLNETVAAGNKQSDNLKFELQLANEKSSNQSKQIEALKETNEDLSRKISGLQSKNLELDNLFNKAIASLDQKNEILAKYRTQIDSVFMVKDPKSFKLDSIVEGGEDFSVFLQKFLKDQAFQKSRTVFPVQVTEIKNQGEEENYTVTDSLWVLDFQINALQQVYYNFELLNKAQSDQRVWEIKNLQNDNYSAMYFRMLNKEWFFVKYVKN